MIGSETNEIIFELFELLLTRYQISLEHSMKCSDFIFYSIIAL